MTYIHKRQSESRIIYVCIKQLSRINPTTDEILEVFKALKDGGWILNNSTNILNVYELLYSFLIYSGNVQSVENSLSSVSVNSEDDHGFTFLMRAAENGKINLNTL